MTRIPSLAASTVIACTTVFAATRAETTTYVDGNLTGVSPNTGGTLVFSDDKSMVFRTGLATVSVPYSAITKSELGATRTTSHDTAFYKVWARHKKTETQFLTVEFKNDEGEAKTMTLELGQASAPSVLATIQDHTNGAAQVASAAPAAPAPVQAAPSASPAASSAPAHEAVQQPRITVPAPAAVASGKPIIYPNDRGSIASPPTKAGSDWWGDDIWKTHTNAATWAKPTGTIAPEE